MGVKPKHTYRYAPDDTNSSDATATEKHSFHRQNLSVGLVLLVGLFSGEYRLPWLRLGASVGGLSEE